MSQQFGLIWLHTFYNDITGNSKGNTEQEIHNKRMFLLSVIFTKSVLKGLTSCAQCFMKSGHSSKGKK